jgi:kinesin family protein 15
LWGFFQEKLFKVAGLPMVENCMAGYNSCMFAYGQVGTNKKENCGF